MTKPRSRRSFLEGMAMAGGLAALVPSAARAEVAAGLSKEEKSRLKAELQNQLERKVYAVSNGLFRQVNRSKDPANLEGHETSHVPKLIAPRQVGAYEAFTVKIEVGADEIHEMNPFHYIDWVALMVGGVEMNHMTLTPLFNRPVVTVEMTLEESATLAALEHCNLHGTWASQEWRIEVLPPGN